MQKNRLATLTGSSWLTCSAGETLRLYAAHKISLDLLRVSSTLHARKRAAADASYPGQSRQEKPTDNIRCSRIQYPHGTNGIYDSRRKLHCMFLLAYED